MTAKLRISSEFGLPLEAVTQTFAILAKRGTGKTYLASVMAEEMLKAEQQVVFIDPVGSCWGLQSGFPVVIFGGEHANVPLEESAGELVARAIVENRFSAVIDLSLLRKGASIRFMVAFAETLYRLNREPLHLFVDEADAFAPQGRSGYGPEENRMLGAMEDIVRRGRKRGLGCTLITQRPSVLNKNVLTQCEVLVAMRLVHPLDIKAVMEWVNVHGEPKIADRMVKSLPELRIGSAWFWSPGWGDFFERVEIRRRETFDSSATPKPGEQPKRPKHLAQIDLDALGEQIKATVAKAKADDPKELRKRIAELERQVKGAPAATATVEIEKRVEVPVLRNGQLTRTEKVIDRTEQLGSKLLAEVAELKRLVAPAFAVPSQKLVPSSHKNLAASQPRSILTRPKAESPHHAQSDEAGPLPIGERLTLSALIQYPTGLAREQLTVLTGYKRSTRDAYIARLREKRFVDQRGDTIIATETGIAALPDCEPLPNGPALQEFWFNKLPEGERAILRVLVDAYPAEVDKDALTETTGYKRSTRDAYLQRLRAKELIEDDRGSVKATENLF